MELVEREEQLRVLGLLLNETLVRKGQVALLDGPAASGKTELLRVFAERAQKSGVLFLSALCSRSERALPFGVISQLVHSAVLPADLHARLVRLLDEGVAEALAARSRPEPAELGQVFHGISLAMLELAALDPLLIGVDDLRHVDTLSLQCLLYLIRRLRSARVLAVLTDDIDPVPSQRPFGAELLRQPHFQRVRVAPLSEAGVARLLAERTDLPAELAPEFHAATGGNPLLLASLAEDHRELGTARPEGYGLAVLSCLHRGDPVRTRVARAVAVLGGDGSPETLAALAGAEPDVVRQSCAALTAAGVLDTGVFRHPVGRQAVLDDLAPDERIELHRRAARLLQEVGASAMTVAGHLIEAGDVQPSWAVTVLLEAAEQALLSDRMELAADSLRLAHRASLGEEDRAAIRARLAYAEWQVNPAAAAEHLAPLAAAMRADQLNRRDCIVLIRQLLWHGRADEAMDLLDRLRSSVREQHTEAAAELRHTELWLTSVHPPLASRRPPAHPAGPQPALVTPKADPGLQATAMLADVLARGRSHEAVDQAEAVLRDIDLNRSTSWAEESAMLALLVLITAGRAKNAADWCDRLLGAAEHRRAPVWRAMFASARATIAVRQGELAAAAEHAELALTQMARKSWGVAIGLPLGSLILAKTRMGRFEEAAQLVTYTVPDAMFQSRYGLPYLYARGNYYLATNHHHAALADFLSCGELMQGWRLEVAGLVPWRTSAAEAWLRLGNLEQARLLVHDQLAQPGTDGFRTRGASLRLLAALSPSPRRLPLLTEALELFESAGDCYEQARVLVDLSRVHYEADDKRRARKVFRRAWHLAKVCDAQPLCAELLSASSDLSTGAGAGEDTAGITSLTSSERRVAALAVIGYTNREIAGKLHITASTVEQHLTRVYRKLNVKRRNDLPLDLRTEPAPRIRLA
ncbi:LuxR family transcriptional regulator [Amycolatopsis sp. YIM 10]|uniref:helix-turn-helix transcriptional regulator n=1 Tax=Amycolatopsis sp. YIM 10 TaxID=2653857 RepID=UPI00129046B5|nr:LuxR family transcriptional regulator [Amycolatopsis sp. YIM 10]